MAQESDPLIFSVESIKIQGQVETDVLAAGFHLLSGAEEVTDIELLPSPLVSEEGKTIAVGQYQVSPTTITALPANSGQLVTINVTQVAAAGTYNGTIEVMYAGRDPAERMVLPIQLVAIAKTELELAPDSSLVTVEARLGLPWDRKSTGPDVFHVRQTVDAPATIVQVALIGPPAAVSDAKRLPADAVTILPAPPLEVKPKLWQTFDVQVDTSELGPGHYAATIVVASEDADEEQVTLDVKLRDHWLWAVAVLGIGVFFSWVISYMATTGAARLQALQTLDNLRARQRAKAGLASDSLTDWHERLAELEKKAKRQDPALAQQELEALRSEMNQATTTTQTWREQLRDWQAELDRYHAGGGADELLGALMASPLVGGLREDIAGLERAIREGDFARGEIEGHMELLARQTATLGALAEALPKLRDSQDEQISNIRPQLKTILEGASSFSSGELARLIALLKEKALMVDVQPVDIVHYEVKAARAEPSRNWFVRLRDWIQEPRVYLPFLNGLLRLLFLFLLLLAGIEALYVGKPIFGADRLADYGGLLLWGIGADASRKQLKDLEGVTGFLRQRLGVEPKIDVTDSEG
jgi:hypothetical protein